VPIFRLVGWLDRQNGRSQHEISMRLLKLVEESGEVAQAYIGSVGQNPRKGVTHTSADVADELCDVIITAMVALVSVADGNPDDILAAKLAKVAKRAADSEEAAR
jgi:NTP pyrophosphatase (non-canonical NTP hydrolase)